ncbi:DUF6414 family protein [Streptomyces sp. R527F]|uniref:DUF6414 family protein n=1 Tax=Streptomyces sp. R527F TaxID=1664033 RepID=UPI001F280C03|nr:hypothetical protein [Streptomyces sp. R527F]UIZ15738.1 hypothetical protein LZ559_26840 [Streptomyces sp. R527F]
MTLMPIPALPRFLYLDEKALSEYLSVVEKGISDESRRRQTQSAPGSPPEGVGELPADASSHEEERVVRETASQRFIRLVSALDTDANKWRYRDIDNLSDVFDELKIMDFLHGHFEVEIPPVIQLMSQPNQLGDMLDMLEAFAPMASLMGQEVDGLPGKAETTAMRGFAKTMKSDVVVVGYQGDTDPQVSGKLNSEYLRDAIEGEVFILGKISRKWKEGESHSLLALPGASLMSREQRRKAARQPKEDDETMLTGPALTLDILAIYR